MAKETGTLLTVAEYAAARVVMAVFAYLPYCLSKRLAFLAADVWRALDRRHENIVISQARERLDLNQDGAKRLAKANYRHYMLFGVEFCRQARLTTAEIMAQIDCRDTTRTMAELLAEGNGAVIITGHLGNWEYGAAVVGSLKLVEGFIARPLPNRLLDNYVNRLRERTGVEVWEKYGSMRKALQTLRKGRALVAVCDQDGGPQGCPAPFLGKDSSTMAAPIDLAIRRGCPIYTAAVMRNHAAPGFTFVGKRVLRPVPGADPVEDRIRLATEMNRDLAEIVKEYPEQWIWIHRRWRTVLG